MNGRNYTPAEHFLVRRMFNNGASDVEIAAALRQQPYERRCGAEAVRKIRRQLGLKKVPTFQRWTWAPFCHV